MQHEEFVNLSHQTIELVDNRSRIEDEGGLRLAEYRLAPLYEYVWRSGKNTGLLEGTVVGMVVGLLFGISVATALMLVLHR